MLSIRVKGGENAAPSRLPPKSNSGSARPRSAASKASSNTGPRSRDRTSPCPPDLLRLSVGLEDTDDLLLDLDHALAPRTRDDSEPHERQHTGARRRRTARASRLPKRFDPRGGRVSGLVRPGAAHRAPHGIKIVETTDRKVAVEAARGMDVVLHALNPPYTKWRQMALPHAYAAIEAAGVDRRHAFVSRQCLQLRPRHAGGARRQTTAWRRRRARGAFARDRAAASRSVRARRAHHHRARRRFFRRRPRIMVRSRARQGPDPSHRHLSGAARLPPHLGLCAGSRGHARAARGCAREACGVRDLWLSGPCGERPRTWWPRIAKAWATGIKVKRMSWWLIHALAPIVPLSREMSEMAYLWKVPHRIAGDKLSCCHRYRSRTRRLTLRWRGRYGHCRTRPDQL